MLYDVEVNVMPLKGLLDPQGKAVLGTVGQLGYSQVQDVRVGKHISLRVEAADEAEVRRVATELCTGFLSNPVMEGFEFHITPAE